MSATGTARQRRARDDAERGAADFSAGRVLPPAFFERPAELVARELLGACLVSHVDGVRCAAEIVEAEAYVGPDDEASHAHERFGRTVRNLPMFGPPGTAYVYRIYGIHWCLNAVTGAEGYPAAVLIRAARPLRGADVMRIRRGGRADVELLRGPGNLARALGVDARQNGRTLQLPPLHIEAGARFDDASVAVGPRIGVSRAADRPLRFWLRGSPHVSAPRR